MTPCVALFIFFVAFVRRDRSDFLDGVVYFSAFGGTNTDCRSHWQKDRRAGCSKGLATYAQGSDPSLRRYGDLFFFFDLLLGGMQRNSFFALAPCGWYDLVFLGAR